jgi:hypothetical protein
MADLETGIVAGLFATRQQAMTVEKDLRRIGLADQDIDVGTPTAGRYRLDVRESEDLGSGALDGIVIGTLIGAVVRVLVLALAVPRAMEMGTGAILLGIPMGGFWGSFFGGLGGMVVKASAHDGTAQWCDIPASSAVLLVIARAGAHADAARKVMRQDGARTFLKQAQSMAVSPVALIGANGAAGAGSAWSEDRSGHEEARSIGVPRGAFLLLIGFLVMLSLLWARAYLSVVGRA